MVLGSLTAWGASQGGTAINAVAPAQAGTATMIGIFRSSIPGSSVAGVTAARRAGAVLHCHERSAGDRGHLHPPEHRLERVSLG
jgi:hypothetical protein